MPRIVANSMTLTSWALRLEGKYRKKFENIACTGDMTDGESFQTVLDVVRVN